MSSMLLMSFFTCFVLTWLIGWVAKKQPGVAGSMVGVRLGLSQHITDTTAIFSLKLDEEDFDCISQVSKRGRDLMNIIGDCGDEYRA
jgi:NADH:ubiquinone oxidoreductase subunit B-like Fe-S oxidoreductase